ncbi:MAG: MaoC family dehydratase N-terminal domain-containing protein [Sphingomonas sp.]|uniref:FAS1-like dehydratase domain-containing protein n=1 Tax=Sphingomonas sp. TaxID=28214 RepID=UPI0035A91310|nr:MaoC family dehydratase N-terminal domain-containing protein [Sphingomonas sp.]
MGAWDAWVGRSEARDDQLTPALLTRFRAMIDSDDTSDIAPQGIHFCLCTPNAATGDLDRDGHPRRGGLMPPVPLPRRMWASSSIDFLSPILAGAAITRQSTVADIKEKTGASGALVFVTLDHLIHADGVAVVREEQTIVYRAASTDAPAPRPPDQPIDRSDWPWHRELIPGPPLLFRYSALTFNTHRIHYDLPYAIEEERYRGLVVHGPLIATLLLNLVTCEIGPNQLRHFAFRGAAPAFAGEPLHLVGRQSGDTITLAGLGGDSRLIMTADARL